MACCQLTIVGFLAYNNMSVAKITVTKNVILYI